MTDAERIANYLNEDVQTVTRIIDEPDNGHSKHVRAIVAMLSDVRREEREACRQIVVTRTAIARERGDEVIHLNVCNGEIGMREHR